MKKLKKVFKGSPIKLYRKMMYNKIQEHIETLDVICNKACNYPTLDKAKKLWSDMDKCLLTKDEVYEIGLGLSHKEVDGSAIDLICAVKSFKDRILDTTFKSMIKNLEVKNSNDISTFLKENNIKIEEG